MAYRATVLNERIKFSFELVPVVVVIFGIFAASWYGLSAPALRVATKQSFTPRHLWLSGVCGLLFGLSCALANEFILWYLLAAPVFSVLLFTRDVRRCEAL
jgi:hypothetical protein